MVQAGRDNLQELDLSRNHLGDEGARALAQALGKGRRMASGSETALKG